MPVGGGGGPPVFVGSPGKALGRISGPLLSDNLLRNGVNLAFDTDVMYLDVNNKFVGFNTDTPVRTLDIFGDGYADDLIVTTLADIAHCSFGGTGTLDQIANYRNENIIITPDQTTDPVITFNGLGSTNKFKFLGADLTGFADQNITFDPSGTGRLVIGTLLDQTSLDVDGNITATGNITFDGDITLGNDPTDTITFAANVGSHIIPDINSTYNLGEDTTPSVWKNIHATSLVTTDFNTTTANITTLNAGNVRISGNTISNTATTNNVNLVPSGTGSLNFNSFLSIKDNTISHHDSVPLEFVSTGNGYFKFGGPTGWVIPLGTTAQRPVNPDLGTIRYNTTTVTPEVYANVSSTTTVTTTAITADINIGDTTIYVDTTVGYSIGDFVSNVTPGIFATPTLITAVVPGVSINIDIPATGFLASGNNISIQRKWIPMIGTSPVLSTDEVTEIMDIWTLILG
jgi:hypothetical protein